MERMHIEFEHCYGIKRLFADFDFSQKNVYAIYAPIPYIRVIFLFRRGGFH